MKILLLSVRLHSGCQGIPVFALHVFVGLYIYIYVWHEHMCNYTLFMEEHNLVICVFFCFLRV